MKIVKEGVLEESSKLRIYSILKIHSNELQGKSKRPTCGGMFSLFVFTRFCFFVGPTRSGILSLPTIDVNTIAPCMTVADLINA